MNCAEFEILLADYLDGTLALETRGSVEEHVVACAGCRQFMSDAAAGLEFASGAPAVEPPPELITRIAFLAPVGRTRHPLDAQGFFSRMASKWFQPLLQPKFAMGMAMTIVSFAMLERCTGVRVQHIQAADLSPVRIVDNLQDKAMRLKDRAVKNYENIRLVYEVERRLRDFEAQQDTQDDKATQKPAASSFASRPANSNGVQQPPKQGDLKK
jgi:putative zinc finger protein